jgi:hypothetical protein
VDRSRAADPESNVKKILGFAAVVELGTGVALMVDPMVVVRLLLGAELSGVGVVAGRCFGIALLALGLACLPRRGLKSDSPAQQGMAIYNALIALYLVGLGTLGSMQGMLLWPAVALHGGVAALLLWKRRSAETVDSS